MHARDAQFHGAIERARCVRSIRCDSRAGGAGAFHAQAGDIGCSGSHEARSFCSTSSPAAFIAIWLAGGLYGAIATLASLRDVRRGRPSRHTDLSLLDIQVALHSYRVPQAIDLGIDFRPQPRSGGSGARPYGVYPTADGRWFAAGITDQFWTAFCQAMGLPDERWGKVVTAFIKRRTAINDEELDQFCRSSGLANYKRPRRYVFVEAIPKSPVGKLLRRLLVAGEYEAERKTPS